MHCAMSPTEHVAAASVACQAHSSGICMPPARQQMNAAFGKLSHATRADVHLFCSKVLAGSRDRLYNRICSAKPRNNRRIYIYTSINIYIYRYVYTYIQGAIYRIQLYIYIYIYIYYIERERETRAMHAWGRFA